MLTTRFKLVLLGGILAVPALLRTISVDLAQPSPIHSINSTPADSVQMACLTGLVKAWGWVQWTCPVQVVFPRAWCYPLLPKKQ